MSQPTDAQPRGKFLNREVSWLAFNQRVLEEAADPSNPLLERVKFFCIFTSNLDEFFEVRVAGLRQQVAGNSSEPGPDGWTPAETLAAVRHRIRQQVDRLYSCWREDLVPALGRENIRFLRVDELEMADLTWLDTFYRERVHPVLTPLAKDKSHPFPRLTNKMLNVVVKLVDTTGGAPETKLGVVQVPSNLPRLVRLPRPQGQQDYIFLGRIVGHFLSRLFSGVEIIGHWNLRVTRNGEFYVDPEEAESLLVAIEQELHNRMKGEAVRLEVSHDCPEDVCQVLLDELGLAEDDLYRINGPLNAGRILGVTEGIARPELRDPPHFAPTVAPLAGRDNIFAAIRERDILLHHPYESFNSVVEFLQSAASDPHVLALKQTMYRTGGDPRIINALSDAARNGKQVTAIIELKARFDEKNNIEWARKLEEAGVHVVYGLLEYKIHAKVALVVRAEPEGIRRYVHLSTGNYNATTARIYTDIGLLTARPDFGEDATALFNLLTGICQFQPMRRFIVAPFELHNRIVDLIRKEQEHAESGLPARIIAKMNSLVDPLVIEALYGASRKGVQIDLIIRGVCCLRPGVPGLSENIRVRSIVDRFLEHSRIFYFENAATPRVYLGSADWMPRNFFRRIEVVFPIDDGLLRDRLVREILTASLNDNSRARLLTADGSDVRARPGPGEPLRRAQMELDLIAVRSAAAANGTATPTATPAPLPGPDGPKRARSGRRSRVTVRTRPENT